MKYFILPILLFISFTAFAQPKTPMVASDLMKIATTNGIQISPDGSKAVMIVNRKAVKNENEYYYTRHLYLLDLTGKEEPRQLTFGDKNDGQPQWSPDGRQIAFVRTDNDKSQIWLLPLNGGEANAITKAEFGATRPRFSPDGKKIMFSSNIPFYAIGGNVPWTYERPGRAQGDEPNWKKLKADEKKNVKNSPDGTLEEVRAWLSKNTLDGNPRMLHRQQLQAELNLQPEEDFTHLFVKTIGADESTQVTTGYQDFEGAEWSADGKKVICHSRIYKIAPDDEQDTDLWTIDTETKTAKEFLTWPGYSLSNPKYSPDGTQILFDAEVLANRHATQTQLAVVSANGSNPLSLTAAFDRDAGQATWSADSKNIYFTAQT
ncbi:MAG: TolB family protein, partial [Flammeovirgaceae bacterium]